MSNTETGSEFKAIIDSMDRLSILTKINNRHVPKDLTPPTTENNQLQITIVSADEVSENKGI